MALTSLTLLNKAKQSRIEVWDQQRSLESRPGDDCEVSHVEKHKQADQLSVSFH